MKTIETDKPAFIAIANGPANLVYAAFEDF